MSKKTTSDEWTETNKTCIVLYPFNASHKFQLPLSVGDLVQVHAQTSTTDEQGGWYSGVSMATQESGIFPQSYVVILPNSNLDETSTPHHVPLNTKLISNQEFANSALLNEITSTIVEWVTLLKIFSQNRQYNDFKVLTQRITSLVQFRNQILAFSNPREITYELRDKIIHVIDEGRQETGMTIVLRKEVSNIYSNTRHSNNNNGTTSNVAISSNSPAADLILADAENTGVFSLCTMYQEKKALNQNENKVLESLKSDLSLTGSNGSIEIKQQQQQPSNSSLTLSPSSSTNNLNQSNVNGLANTSSNNLTSLMNNNNINNNNSGGGASGVGGSSKEPKFSKQTSFLSSVRMKGKDLRLFQSSTNLTSSGGIPPQNSQGGSPSSSNLSLSQSTLSNSSISVTSQSPSTLTNGQQQGGSSLSLSGGSQSNSGSSLNLNSPLISGSNQKKQSLSSLGGLNGSTGMLGSSQQGQNGQLSQAGVSKKGSTFFNNAQGAANPSLNQSNPNINLLEQSIKNIQLLVSLNNFLYSSGEYLEMIFGIYNKNDSKFITENYSGWVPPSGIFMEPENPSERICTIFKDMDLKDLQSELYLVARIYRRTNSISTKDANSSPTLSRSSGGGSGGMASLNTPPPPNSRLFRKYIGCGVKRLDLMNLEIGVTSEALIQLYTTSNESNLHNLHELIIAETPNSFEPITRAKGIVFSLQMYSGEYAQFLNEHITMRNISISQKLTLPEVVLPGYDRNDMYVQIEEGDFSDKNIEVGMVIRSENGVVLNDTIKFANGQGEVSEYRTPILSSAQGRWSETVRVWMAAKVFERSHMLFYIRQCSEKKDKERQIISFGHLKFMGEDGAIVKDGTHTIQLYKQSTDDIPIASYINGISEPTGKDAKKNKPDTIKIRTTFVSTCLTQNPTVVNLSRWQSFQGDLSSLIKDITFLGSQELMRNLQEIFYNFLAILDQQLNDSPLSMEIFRSFIFIIGVLVDSRTTNYRSALDAYVAKYFGIPLNLSGQPAGIAAHSHLLRSVVKNLENFQDPANASRISSSLKALEYIFKMVVASKTKFPNKETTTNESYQTNLKNVVDILCEIMMSNSPSLIGAQTIALKNFEGLFSDLKRFFTIDEMAIIAVKFMKSIQTLEKNKTFNLLKLKLMASYIHGQLMLNKETRKQLHPIVFQLLQFHFGKSTEETDMCLTILGLIVDIMITKTELRGKDKDPWLVDMMSFFMPVLELLQLINANIALNSSTNNYMMDKRRSSSSSVVPNGASMTMATLVSTMPEENQYDLRLKIYAFLLGTSRLAGVQNWEMFAKNLTINPKTFFVDLYDSLQILFTSPKFPTDFWTFTVFQLKTILRMTRILEDVIFYNSPEKSAASKTPSLNQYDFSLWRSFFLMTSSYLNCKDLQLESVNPAKAIFLKTRCGDVRIEMARVLERVWTTVPIKERTNFIPVLIDPIIKLSISDTIDAKRVATKIYFDMLESEILSTQSYSDLANKTIDSLLEIGTGVSDGMTWPVVCFGVEGKLPFTLRTFHTFFNVQCMQLVLGKSAESTKKKAESFINEINQFLTLLTNFMSDLKGMDEEEIFSSVSKLMVYLSETKRTNHFIRFVHMVSKRHFANGNFIEAGTTVMLHAQLYQWDHNKLVNSLNNDYGAFPVQKESERKEILYKEILACFNKGKAWERAIPLLKELIHHFTMNICDMNAAATYLRQQGTFYQKINESELIFEEYFRVGYYGKKFPSNIQNKEFIYKGNEFERLSDFIAKMNEKYPKAELLKSTEPPSQQIMDSDHQYLLITSVNVSNISEIGQKRQSINISSGTDKRRIPQRVQQFNARTKVNVFLYSKPFKKQPNKKSANEFEDLWLMNQYLVCETSFPSTERRSMIVERHQVEVSPIENALNTIVSKNEELLARIDRYTTNQNENINPLTMTLNGIIDAAVNGGVSRYELFFSDDYLSKNPENKHFSDYLRIAMDQQIVVLEKALKLHATLRPPDMAAMQDKLESIFNTMKSERTKSNPSSTFV